MNTAQRYELLAANYSPVALLVLNRAGHIRHVNYTMSLLLGQSGRFIVDQPLDAIAPELHAALQPLMEDVMERGRPRRAAGLSLPLRDTAGAEQTWDIACALIPPDLSRTPPELVAVWLWAEHSDAAASRQTIAAIRAGLHDVLPTTVPGFEVAAALVPSGPGASLGGDTYDVVFLGDSRWALMMADVVGRGPAAAARAVMVRHSARVLAARYGPAEALDHLSSILLADTSFAGFVTAFLGILDTTAGTLHYVVAGHEPALLLRGETGEIEELEGDGALPLAVDDELPYREQVTTLTPRDTLLLYTDGLTDSRHDDEFFSQDRVRAALLRDQSLPAAALVATLLAEAAEWAGPDALRDDTALLALRGQNAG